MRPYEFKFSAGEGRESCECEWLLDLDKLVAVGAPYFDHADWIAYVNLYFQGGHRELEIRCLTGYRKDDDAFQAAEFQRFREAVDALKAAWTGS